MNHTRRWWSMGVILWACAGAFGAYPGSGQARELGCDASLARHFAGNGQVRILAVRPFRKGEALPNPLVAQQMMSPGPSLVMADLCMVKLIVGRGNPGPASAPSTSAGIGVEIWLPAKAAWNGRVHALGGGGWAGGEEADAAKVSAWTATSDLRSGSRVAAEEGAVASTTDTGHSSAWGAPIPPSVLGAFAMNPDGSINRVLLKDFSGRALHVQAVMTRAVATAYYGKPPRYSYFDSSSTGGRLAMKLAQSYPDDYNGIISGFPALNFTRFGTAELYPQIVIQRDLDGRYMSADQLDLVSTAAIAACDMVGDKHLGFILDPARCRYDPTKDPSVLCTANKGLNSTPACLSGPQAMAVNKIWYGLTSDGSAPDPAVENGFEPLSGQHLWYGLPRGTNLLLLASPAIFSIATDIVALELRDAAIATSSFRNAHGSGADGWKQLSYAKLAQAFAAGIAANADWGDLNTDNPDLSAFKAHGGKLIHYHGGNDGLIPVQGSIQYYRKVLDTMGGAAAVQVFYRFYIFPGMAHGSINGTANPKARPPVPPVGGGDLYRLLVAWVEKGSVPEERVWPAASGDGPASSLRVCTYPRTIRYVGGGVEAADAFVCQ